MTYEEFGEKLAALNLKWIVRFRSIDPDTGYIRCENGDCPLIALAKHDFPGTLKELDNSEWLDAAMHLNMSLGVAKVIVHEADKFRNYRRPSWIKNLDVKELSGLTLAQYHTSK